jgi:hypothetical protein
MRYIAPCLLLVTGSGRAVYPDMGSREMEVGVGYINCCVGAALDAPAVAALLSRMALQAEALPGGGAVRVRVPPTRSDVLHACDVMEARRPGGPPAPGCRPSWRCAPLWPGVAGAMLPDCWHCVLAGGKEPKCWVGLHVADLQLRQGLHAAGPGRASQ